MVTTKKAAIVGMQHKNGNFDADPGTILITTDGIEGRVYFKRGNVSMEVRLSDMMDALKIQIGGGNT